VPHSPVPAESLTPEQQALLMRRYGSRRTRSWPLVAAVAVTAVLFVGWVIWAGWGQADQQVRWRTVGYVDTAANSVTVEFEVFKPQDEDVVCIVRALDTNSKEVGRAEVLVSTPQSDVNITYDLQVTERPNTAEVFDCRLDSPRSTTP
jgi:hypothetical protein